MTSKQLPNVSGQSEIRLMLGCRAGRWEDAKLQAPQDVGSHPVSHIFSSLPALRRQFCSPWSTDLRGEGKEPRSPRSPDLIISARAKFFMQDESEKAGGFRSQRGQALQKPAEALDLAIAVHVRQRVRAPFAAGTVEPSGNVHGKRAPLLM